MKAWPWASVGRLESKGYSERDPGVYVTMIIDETALAEALRDFAWRILALSIVISLITASLVYIAMQWLAVRPLAELSAKMLAFSDDPEESDSVIVPGKRTDEVGVAQRELHDMQIALRGGAKTEDPACRAGHGDHKDQSRSAQHSVHRLAIVGTLGHASDDPRSAEDGAEAVRRHRPGCRPVWQDAWPTRAKAAPPLHREDDPVSAKSSTRQPKT